ncbi:cytoplasmic 60S subunit biogenesis factor ZNF622 [Dunckerocampus dactyliophorus]|uniref:cytoplasmic 60S subunit biogenesis factor ZNF622 n=1 Tax=Dunckerocampus dactyliophorus TaxID=161453 RepID=UPI0024066D0A|nr:cytoplasmic 60S subunit biogenesis factor ZNF622 [Dunckerocampus dactyliophorus]XP_054616586.1 cytoplasmic 60S subunit biogenesis factor ZNF622 [Dunckerocampus dactyliophorus]
MASYTCISCRVAFADGDVQRAHYKSDWHRYNLKRKVADMPPVTAENFQERVMSQRAAAEQQLSEAGSVEGCAMCNKKFSSANAFQNHLQSHKHQQAERQALLAAQREVDKLNEKNLEKGLDAQKADHDAQNQALQQVLKEQLRAGQVKTSQDGTARRKVEKSEKPPRLMWLEEQAKRREREDTAATEEEDWEDMDEDDDDDDVEDEEEDSMDQEEKGEPQRSPALPGSIPVTDCLFCSHHSKSLFKNVAHMTHVHSFFIPDLDFLVDLKGLVRYLGEKVGAGNVCLWCNEKGRSFYSTDAVQSHMTDKSHCKLFTDGDAALEFADFYDFRSSYPDSEEGQNADMEGVEVPDENNLQYDDDTLELTLPSGARIGHRSLMRYYKQRFGTQRTLVSHNKNAVGRVLRHYKAIGWGGDTGNFGLRHKQDMQYVQMMKSKWLLKMGMSHNATKQKHFRVQVMF